MFQRPCAVRQSAICCTALLASFVAVPVMHAQQQPKAVAATHWAAPQVEPDSVTDGSVTVDGKTIQYEAVAGTLVVGSTDAQDAGIGLNGKYLPGAEPNLPANPADRPAAARIYYAAYFMKNAPKNRPVTFLYNGGPGSSSMYLHMGAFGPERIVLPQDASHPAAAPYKIVPNQYSLLDASDLVFIDAPGTGFSRIYGKNAAKAFYGTDQDAHAFDRFIRRFLNKYNRWNSPKFLFGESYGTTRTAVLSNLLEHHFDLNGSIFLSQILNFDDSADGPQGNPGTENGYILALPSMAATAWYHHRIANAPATLLPWLTQVEHFALGPYASALLQGSDLPQSQKEAIAAKLASYTGLSAAYWLKANLRVSGGEFSHELQANDSITTGRLDTRYQGPALNPLSGSANYDPFDGALTSPYDSAVNQYTRDTLKYGLNQTYKPSAYGPDFNWDLRHNPPGERGWDASVNVMPDLANAMKRNPKLKVLLMGGYYDLGCTFFAAEYEDKHLQIPASLDSNISYHFFETGHMVYVTTSALKQLHQVAADFIRANENSNQ